MYIDRLAIKQQAKETIRTSSPNAVSVGAVFLVLSVVIAFLSSKLIGGNISQADAQKYLNYIIEENFDAAAQLITKFTPSPASYFIDFALQLMLAVVSAGFIIFLLNTIRKTAPCYGNLLDGFAMIWRVFVLNFLEWLFIALWSLLLIVPGIIAAYSYRQALYLLIDHPEKSPLQCIRESKAMMVGHKWELFLFDLSFFGWWLLCLIPFVSYVVQIWTTPYFGMSRALYYEALCGRSYSYADSTSSPSGEY